MFGAYVFSIFSDVYCTCHICSILVQLCQCMILNYNMCYILIYVLITIQLLLYLHMLYIFVSMFEILFMYSSCNKICLTGVSGGYCRLKNEGT